LDNQHRKISGYRELSQEEIDLMNRIKAFGPELQKLCSDLEAYIHNREDFDGSSLNWMQEGRLSLQKGLMFLTRSVANPTFF
jgi:hypothetical protein